MGLTSAIIFLSYLACCRASKCSFVPDVDYTTTDGGETKASSQDECCAACIAIPDCIAGVFQAKSSTCYLKGGHVKALPPDKNKGIVACVARTPAPLPPPFNCSDPGANCAGRLGATHWNPCYFINSSIPSLLDGAQSLAKTGSRVIKVATFSPAGNYPFNSPDWSKSFPTLLSIVSHDYYRQLWQMPEFDTYVLIAYSSVGGDGGGDISYWKHGITAAQAAEETKQLRAAATFLLQHYGHLGKTFVFENWEGDWASRDNYDPKTPATPLALASMRTWLEARQSGITLARQDYHLARATAKKKTFPHRSGKVPSGKVFFSAEVNLVYASMTTGAANMVNRVLPYVATDMVSYSSYDTQASPEHFTKALSFIAAHHNRTAASPPGSSALFVAEYGVGENTATPDTVSFTVTNVVRSALRWGAAYVLYWETFDNECVAGRGVKGCNAGGRCDDKNNPVTNPKDLHGFWLVRPDGSKAWPFTYLRDLIAG